MASTAKTHLRVLSLALLMVTMAMVVTEVVACGRSPQRGCNPLKGDVIPCDKKQHAADCRPGTPANPYHHMCDISNNSATDPHGPPVVASET
ncbi:hypothetical protein AMTRI_Chr07g75520 [Amborella trichopoda]